MDTFMKILNKDLFENAKDIEIAQLKNLINQFKEYDKKRKEFYAEKMKRLGELESYVAEIEDEHGIENMRLTIKSMETELKRLRQLIKAYKIDTTATDEELNEKISAEKLRIKNQKLKVKNKILKDTVSELIYKINNKEGA